MSLDHRQHVEACALLRRVVDDVGPLIPYCSAIEAWLEENHPEPEAYMAAAHSLVGEDVGASDGE